MELRDFAEQVLFGTTVADKLVVPDRLSDREPGSGLRGAVPTPGRPTGLRFEDRGDRTRVKRPGSRVLSDPQRAGRLLHAFANHELLAAELMALVLLRFPEAPGPFRRALAQTLREEQLHLSLYLERMGELGVEFGEIPVNSFFWDCVADVPTPLDFVVRMGLVFEQANLDFCRTYAGRFREIGDEDTARILDKVYADEVGHVKHGLHWFRQWKEPERDEWEAFVERLELPLDPSRARALGYDRDARLAMGFTPEYLDQLEVWGRSKGRTPVVWCFDPTAEDQVAGLRGPSKAGVAALRRDLSGLMGVLAATGDAVLVSRPPPAAFLRPWRAVGLPEVEWIASGDPPGTELSGLDGRHIRRVEPWGRSPALMERLAPLEARASDPVDGADDGRGASRRWWSKAIAQAVSIELAADPRPLPGELDWYALSGDLGRSAYDAEEARETVHELLGQHEQVVLKGVFSTTGRGLRRVRRGEGSPWSRATEGWLRKQLAQHGVVVVQPWLERVLDLSFHLDVHADGSATFVDWTRFLVDGRGQFRGTVLGKRLSGTSRELLRFFFGDGRQRHWMPETGRALATVLGPRLAAAGIRGAVGIDAFVYRDAEGGLRLQPLVEINPRWTMGRVALAIEKHVAAGQMGLWTLLGGPGFRPGVQALLREHPLDARRGHFAGGVLGTTPLEGAEVVWSGLIGGKDLDECLSRLGG